MGNNSNSMAFSFRQGTFHRPTRQRTNVPRWNNPTSSAEMGPIWKSAHPSALVSEKPLHPPLGSPHHPCNLVELQAQSVVCRRTEETQGRWPASNSPYTKVLERLPLVVGPPAKTWRRQHIDRRLTSAGELTCQPTKVGGHDQLPPARTVADASLSRQTPTPEVPVSKVEGGTSGSARLHSIGYLRA